MKNKENTIGEKIRKAIKEAGLTQQKLADKLGVTNPVINVWVTGKRNPTIESIKKIAKATNKPYSFFIDGEFEKAIEAIPLTPKNTIALPILADVPAGLPEWSERDVEMFVDIPRFMFPGADFIVRCVGDSLMPHLNIGDYCVIRKQTEIAPNKPMLVETEDGYVMKIVKIGEDGTPELHSTNPKYKPIKPAKLRVVGQILGMWRRMDKGGIF